jgi:hypothetical protein
MCISAQTGVRVSSRMLFRESREITNCLRRRSRLLWTIFVVLLVLWAFGLATSYTMGGFIHILLVLAIVVVLIRVIQGRRVIG